MLCTGHVVCTPDTLQSVLVLRTKLFRTEGSWKMKSILWISMAISIFVPVSSSQMSASRILERKRRYIGFPEGSSFSCAVCMTVGSLGNPSPSVFPGIFTFGLNWGIAYELPNETETAQFFRKRHKKPVAQRRSRREFYNKLEVILDKMGYGGRECILKTLCETTQRIAPHSDNIVEEIFRILFTMPITKVLPTEPIDHSIYDAAHRFGVLMDNCDRYRCPLSLVDWAMGYYNTPSPDLNLFENPLKMFRSSFD